MTQYQNQKQLERWMLPDGIGELLPDKAHAMEQMRRHLLDLYARWGYELIEPPLLEFTESLLLNTNRDLDLQTLKLTDQLSGRAMGIRADITPQAARIDAHSLGREGPVRLCYAATVLHSRPANALASRAPVQLGVECFGTTDLMADTEVISVMIETLKGVGLDRFVISLGHVEVFRACTHAAELDADQVELLLDIMQRKALVELESFLAACSMPSALLSVIRQLPVLNGSVEILPEARQVLSVLGRTVDQALGELQILVERLSVRYPEVELQIDLAEIPGYHYHNGVVFAAYTPGHGSAIANGGRYDALSKLFGRDRPATGFNADLKTLFRLGQPLKVDHEQTVFVVMTYAAEQWQAIQSLRDQGTQVVCVAHERELDTLAHCGQQLVCEQGVYRVKSRSR